MAITKNIVDMMGGTIEVQSAPEKALNLSSVFAAARPDRTP